jgi:hypothetical protein
MGGTRLLVASIVCLGGCVAKREAAEPVQPSHERVLLASADPNATFGTSQPPSRSTQQQQQQPPQQQPQQPQQQPQQQPPQQQPYPPQQQPYPPQQQPYPPQQQPYPPQQQPYPPQQQPYPPQQPYPQQGYPQQGYPQQGYPQQSYPPPQAYPPPAAYPAPMAVTGSSSSRRLHDGEVIADFAIVGTLGAIDVLARQEVENPNAISFTVLAGLAGGGGIGYLLTQKYKVDSGAAHSTTLGMALGIANGALLIEPTGWTRSESVLNLLFLGSAIGATGGFIYGQSAKLTSGQSMFVANLTLLGTATAALGAISGSTDGEFGNPENVALTVGIDGGAILGAVIAPHLDWSPKRARTVFAASVIGAFVGGMFAGLLAKPADGGASDANGNIVTGTMTAGMWGGFGLGIMMTRDTNPDPKFTQPTQPNATSRTGGAPTAIAPWIGEHGRVGLLTGGSF